MKRANTFSVSISRVLTCSFLMLLVFVVKDGLINNFTHPVMNKREHLCRSTNKEVAEQGCASVAVVAVLNATNSIMIIRRVMGQSDE